MDFTIQEHLNDFLYLDIETLPAGEKKSIEEMKEQAPKNYTKDESKEKWAAVNIEKEYRNRAINSIQGRLYCVSFAMNNEPIRTIEYNDEDKMIKEFSNILLNDYPRIIYNCGWVGHYITGFDIPWLGHRMIKYNIRDLLIAMPDSPYNKRVVDTADKWRLTDGNKKNHTSLNDICEFLGIAIKGDIDGGKVYDYYLEGKHEDVYHYCEKDVERVRQLHNKIRGGN